QLLHRQVDLEDVAAGLVAGAGVAVALLRGGQRLAGVAVALADATGALLAVAELRDVDRRQGDRDEVLALLADHLAAGDVLRQVRLHLAANDFAEALVVALDLLAHGVPLPAPLAVERPARPQAGTDLLLRLPPGEDAGDEVEHVRGARLVVAVVLDQPAL